MKVEQRRVEAFLDDPGSFRVALFYGDDIGLIRTRSRRLLRSVAGAADDPFRVVDTDTPASVPVEVASLPLSGGRRVVRLRDASDAAMSAVQSVLSAAGPGFLVLEGGGLASRSKLRALLEGSPEAAVVACYAPDERTLASSIRNAFSEAGVTASKDAVEWLVAHLGADHVGTASEIAKLGCYAGPKGQVDLETARMCVGDMAGLSLDDALFSATIGDVAGADRALTIALSEGSTPVGVLRAGLLHLHRLTRARLALARSADVADAIRSARPPVFFRQQSAFRTALGTWSPSLLGWATTICWDAEHACKRTGAPGELICRHIIARLAQQASNQQASNLAGRESGA